MTDQSENIPAGSTREPSGDSSATPIRRLEDLAAQHSLALLHFRIGRFVRWLADIFPDGPPPDWLPPIPLWTHPGVPAESDGFFERLTPDFSRDAANETHDIRPAIAVLPIDSIPPSGNIPKETTADVILYTLPDGSVVEALTRRQNFDKEEKIDPKALSPDDSLAPCSRDGNNPWIAWPVFIPPQNEKS